MTDFAAPRFAFMQRKAKEHGIYRVMERPASVGDVRQMEWRYEIAPVSQTDMVWAQRCKDYWELQQATYGLALTDFSMVVDYGKGTVRTFVCVQKILPGKRVSKSKHRAWFKDMLKEAEERAHG